MDKFEQYIEQIPDFIACPNCGRKTLGVLDESNTDEGLAIFSWPCDGCECYIEFEAYRAEFGDEIIAGSFCYTEYGEDKEPVNYAHNSALWRPSASGVLPDVATQFSGEG